MTRRSFGKALLALGAVGFGGKVFAEEPVPARDTDALRAKELLQEKMQLIADLDRCLKSQHRELSQRNKQHTQRYHRIENALLRKNWGGHAQLLLKEWQKKTGELKPYMSEGVEIGKASLNFYAGVQGGLEKILQRWERWEHLNFTDADDDPQFPERYAKIFEERKILEKRHERLLMTKDDGEVLGLFPQEKRRNPSLTHAQYFDMLGKQLSTPEDIAFFQRYFFSYVHDSPDPDADPLRSGTNENHGDYWQRPEETLERVQHGWMLGDCEDQAIFFREIIKRWGEKPFVLYMTTHCTCIWIRENEEGRFDAYDLGNTGLDKNGSRFGVASNNIIVGASYIRGDPYQSRGFATPYEALESVCAKYRHFQDFDLQNFDITAGFLITHDTQERKRNAKGKPEHKDLLLYVPKERILEHVRMQPPAAPLPPPETGNRP